MKSLSENEHKFHWCIKGTLETAISSSDLWNIISSPSNLELFHPFCDKNPTINWPGLNSIDQIYYYSGLILERKFVKWVDNQGYNLFIGTKNGKKSFVTWEIEDKGKKSKLIISIYPHIYNQGKKIVNFLPFFLIVKPSLTNYINSVISGLGYYINTNNKVKKNQFGTHKLFSN
ncbi:MAG: hypothetical protein CMF96_02605 [Candidatus Marinimicrobia bacterium]|nr:hypothetical protein [Candidatus Neomarinimicrobiota bacterium]MAJ43620.1 hypothetical protein [Candidatus Neomarinimicrobiota bacterium]|tara:strand:+ start:1564 stop:2085 length:522 start_codon:yes stop_codon:yes gene_type:complete